MHAGGFMQPSVVSSAAQTKFPPFDLIRLLETVFDPKPEENICVLIDLDSPTDVIDFAFLDREDLHVQKKAYAVFYQGLLNSARRKFKLGACDFFAYETTGGSNLELPDLALSPDGADSSFQKDIYPFYDIILCISTYSGTAPLTASSKKFGFRGATMHGLNDRILSTGLAVDYNEVSRQTEKMRKAMTGSDSADIDFEVNRIGYHLHIELGRQDAQKSHGICRQAPDIVNLPAGEVYYVPVDAEGSFPIKFDDGTLGVMYVDRGRVNKVGLIEGNQQVIDDLQTKLDSDPATGVLGELGFGTQLLPFAGADIQDEKIFGTFHLATGRNDHLKGEVTLKSFLDPRNATHEDILFSAKAPEIQINQVRMHWKNRTEVLIEHNEPSPFLWKLLKNH